jgi:CRP-like cAMP-binding protein
MPTGTRLPVESFKRRTVTPGEVVFLEGQPADQAYVILKGEVQVAAFGNDNSLVVLNRMGPGQIFGEIALLRPNGKRSATIVSEGGCELIEIERGFFDESLAKADPLLRYVVEHLCERLTALTVLAAKNTRGQGD